MSTSLFGRDLLNALKATAGRPGPALSLPVGLPLRAVLRPVATQEDLLNTQDIHRLTEWRNRYVRAFLTEFRATESRTARWLTEVVGPSDNKILFMVDALDGRTFGYMGLDYIDWNRAYGEADAIVRGAEIAPGTMKRALQTLMVWAHGVLGLRELGVRVLSDNSALEFYRKVGFHEVRRIALSRVEEPEMIRWMEDESQGTAERYLVYMRWQGHH